MSFSKGKRPDFVKSSEGPAPGDYDIKIDATKFRDSVAYFGAPPFPRCCAESDYIQGEASDSSCRSMKQGNVPKTSIQMSIRPAVRRSLAPTSRRSSAATGRRLLAEILLAEITTPKGPFWPFATRQLRSKRRCAERLNEISVISLQREPVGVWL